MKIVSIDSFVLKIYCLTNFSHRL